MPPALAESSLIVASAPLIPSAASAVMALFDHTPRQVLFGWEAQLQAFARHLAGLGRPIYLIPAPEIFSTAESIAHMAETTGWDGRGTLTHLRFGTPYYARVLKGAQNVMVLAEHRITLPLTPTYHPFAAGNRLPAAMARLALYQPQNFRPCGADGRALPADILARGFATADLPPRAEKIAPPRPSGGTPSGLIARSFAEYDPALWPTAWHLGEGGHQAPGAGGAPLRDWRGAITLRDVARERGEAAPPFVMVPWNLAHPASIVGDLVEKLARAGGLAATGLRLVLFPYNETETALATINAVVDGARARLAATPGDLRHLFLARLVRHVACPLLPSLFDVAWLEAEAPDRLWTERRLAALGLPAALLATSETVARETPPAILAPRFSLPADEERLVATDDQFGERLFHVGTLSARALAEAIAQSRAMHAGEAVGQRAGGGEAFITPGKKHPPAHPGEAATAAPSSQPSLGRRDRPRAKPPGKMPAGGGAAPAAKSAPQAQDLP